MDLFVAACQGLGLALAAGIVAGAFGRRGTVGALLMTLALLAGAALFGLSLSGEDHPAWPGWPVGALAAAFAFGVTRDVAEGAASRAGEADASGLLIALAGLALAGLSLLFGPLALIALAAIGWLALARRKRAARKYEGLRTLR